ncbi:MAG: class II aldolase/adducin family protein [Micromonosporaceae bacterium]
MLLAAVRAELAAACRRLAAQRLVIGTAGNLSARHGDLIAVTPTGGVLGELTAEQMTVIDVEGAVLEGALAPTSEVALHTRIYRDTAAGAIAHAHALATTAVACVLDELPVTHYMQLTLGGAVRTAPYATFGTEQLAENVVTALQGRVAALMANHGSIAYGDSVAAACDRLELLEWCAELHARCHALGEPRLLSGDDLDAVTAAMARRRYGSVTPHQDPADNPG